jgi:hypothetical protein
MSLRTDSNASASENKTKDYGTATARRQESAMN